MLIVQANNHNAIRGGSETVFHETSTLLTKNGHEVIKLYFGVGLIDHRGQSYRFHGRRTNWTSKAIMLVSGRFIFDYYNYWKYVMFFKGVKPDILHVHIFYGWLSNAIILAAHRCGVPVVMSNHEYRWTCPVYTHIDARGEICNACADSPWNSVLKRCNKGNVVISLLNLIEILCRDHVFKTADKIDGIVMVSDFIKVHTGRLKPNFLSKSVVLNNFVAKPDGFVEAANRSRRELVFFGRISREKGLTTLVQAMSKFEELTLNVVGGGDLDLLKKAGSNIVVHGKMPRAELMQLVGRCAFSVIPSEWYENNPMSLIESLGLGVPVIGARIGGIPEMIHHGQTGYLFESGSVESLEQAIIEAMSLSESAYAEMCSAALNFFENNYLEAKHYERLMTIYRQHAKNCSNHG